MDKVEVGTRILPDDGSGIIRSLCSQRLSVDQWLDILTVANELSPSIIDNARQHHRSGSSGKSLLWCPA